MTATTKHFILLDIEDIDYEYQHLPIEKISFNYISTLPHILKKDLHAIIFVHEDKCKYLLALHTCVKKKEGKVFPIEEIFKECV